MDQHPTLILTQSDVRRALDLPSCVEAVEAAFARSRGARAAVLAVHGYGGGFHVKAAALELDRAYFAAKVNGNFPANPSRRGLPTIQGALVLSDASDGRVLAVMDSIALTILRTAAATAVAAKHLARRDAASAAIVGCGAQASAQLAAVHLVRPLRRAWCYDADAAAARRFADAAHDSLGVAVAPAASVCEATRGAAIVVTCTTATRPFLGADDVAPGAFVAAVGADAEHKSELEPGLMAAATIVVDVLEQCAAIGDLHHALVAGAVARESVHAELGDVVAGRVPGRRHDDERIIFDSTGTALQDVAAAVVAWRRAGGHGAGVSLELGA